MSRKIVIVGGVAGGASAAAKARRIDERAEITVFERGPYVSFANCGLPYFISGKIAERDDLLLQTPERLWERFRIRVLVRHEVLSVDRATRRVEVRNLDDGTTFWEPYDKLVLSTGAGAIVPALPGLPARNVFSVKTVPDADAVKDWIRSHRARRAVVVGAGFIGLETAEALHDLGLDVSVVELLPQVLPPLDSDVASFVAEHLRARGIHLWLEDGIASISGSGEATGVVLRSGRELAADVVILSIGVRPELKLAREAGLAIGAAGGVVVDERMRTSDPDIYAAGDAVEIPQLVTGRPARIALAGPANKEGRVAGANAAGGDLRFPGALGTAIVECLGLVAGKTGLSEREAAKEGLQTVVSWTHPNDHAGYYPGAEPIHLKLVAEAGTGRLLGAQAVGGRGVDKRLDVLATALQARMKVTDLEDLDLAYAPQFSSAKDPVVLAGSALSNALRGEAPVVSWSQLEAELKAGETPQLLDVRTAAERAEVALPGSLHIPLDELRDRLGELDPARDVVCYCRVGHRGYVATRILRQRGFERTRNLTGGVTSCPASALARG